MTSGRCAWAAARRQFADRETDEGGSIGVGGRRARAAARRQFADRETDEGGSIGFFGGAVPCPRCPGGMSPPAGDLQKSVLIGTAPRQFFELFIW